MRIFSSVNGAAVPSLRLSERRPEPWDFVRSFMWTCEGSERVKRADITARFARTEYLMARKQEWHIKHLPPCQPAPPCPLATTPLLSSLCLFFFADRGSAHRAVPKICSPALNAEKGCPACLHKFKKMCGMSHIKSGFFFEKRACFFSFHLFILSAMDQLKRRHMS